jgi:hypothetical protein
MSRIDTATARAYLKPMPMSLPELLAQVWSRAEPGREAAAIREAGMRPARRRLRARSRAILPKVS